MAISYKQALDYMYGLTNYEIKSTFDYAPEFFNLSRVENLLAQLGSPQNKFQCVHVAGTKGKGSTSVMLASILQTAGYRTGLYTSPHLHTFRERIQVNGEYITEEDFAHLTERVRAFAELDKELTTFEVATALAFDYFAQVGTDIVVVEVGLGGRLDATNVVHPLVSVITTIGHDHMHILGKTLAQIAREKAGIIKPATPVVSAPQEHAAMAVIEQVCQEKKAPLYPVGLDWTWRAMQANLQGQVFSVSGKLRGTANNSNASYKALHLPLLGKHQLRNATVVLATLQVLRRDGWHIDETAVHQGLSRVVWPARFEVMGSHPSFVVEGAHNVDSARCLAQTLQQYFPGQRPWLVLGILADKDVRAILHQLLPSAQGAIFVRTPNPRAANPTLLQREAAGYAVPTEIVQDIPPAVQRAIELAGEDGLVVATGSFTTAATAREVWLQLHNLPMPPLDPQ